MTLTLASLAQAMGAELLGNGEIEITGAAEPADAGPDQIALAMDPKYAEALGQGRARAAVLWPGADWRALGLEGALVVERAARAMVAVTQALDPGPDIAPGIHPSAIIDPTAEIGPGAAIGPFAVIGAGVRLGPGARIGAHVVIGAETRIGARALLHPGVRIGSRTVIGDGFLANMGAVIGADGFAFKTLDEASMVEKSRARVAGLGGEAGELGAPPEGSTHWHRVHSLGNVEIGDNVEIGANSTIDKGTIRATRIGSGTKIDNQVQVGHNCQIGRDCLLAGAVGVSGSVKMGDRVVLGGQVGVSDNVFIGSDVLAAGRTAIYTNVPAGRVIWGDPAVKMDTQMAINRELRRLPRLARAVRALQKAVSKTGEID